MTAPVVSAGGDVPSQDYDAVSIDGISGTLAIDERERLDWVTISFLSVLFDGRGDDEGNGIAYERTGGRGHTTLPVSPDDAPHIRPGDPAGERREMIPCGAERPGDCHSHQILDPRENQQGPILHFPGQRAASFF